MEFRTKQEAEVEIAAEEDSAGTFDDLARRFPEAVDVYRYKAREARAEAARLRALLPTLPEK